MISEQQWRALVSGEARGVGAGLARTGLTLGAGLYRVGLEANLAIYRWGLRRQTTPVLPVISVGNLTLGGTGKSTVVRYLARELQAREVTPGVVLRGHGRVDSSAVVLASDGRGGRAPLEQTGDEAAELARALPGVPVGVGKRREVAVALLAGAGAQVAILDDGYQYFRMARSLNIALVSARLDPRTARLFPRGVLREPWSHLDRSDQVWITHADHVSADELQAVREFMARQAPGKPLVTGRHAPAGLASLQGDEADLGLLAGKPVVALSGLGCPESFEYTLGGLGADVTPLRFADHHRYTEADWGMVARAAAGGGLVVTTEKDAVKLPPDPPVPIWVLRSEFSIISGGDVVAGAVDRVVGTLTQGSR